MSTLLLRAFVPLGLGVLTQEVEAPQPELLAVPSGWTFERLELPLSFAPDLDYEGFEEIALTPNMFDPSSPQHWSYALALRLDGDVAVDRRVAEDLFTQYYRGLCAAVGGSRGFDLDLAAVDVTAVLTDGPLRLTVELFDVFADGAALTLSLELDTHATPTATELFGIASPAPSSAPIWDELRAVRASWWESRPPAVYLNHLFWVPDPETYEALRGSELLQHLAVCEERTTVRQDLTYTGLYAYGQRTYFEFLKPAGGPLAPGASGIAFGHEAQDGIDHFAEALAAQEVRTFGGLRTRALADQDVPWFRILGVEAPHPNTRLSLFSMEYDPGFLNGWHGDLAPDGTSRRRDAVLERYAASQGAGARRDEAPLLDVSTVYLALDPAERARFVTVVRAAGFDVAETSAGPTSCRGPGVEFRIEHAAEPGGVTGFDARLREPWRAADLAIGDPLEHSLGALTLTLVGREARVRFE